MCPTEFPRGVHRFLCLLEDPEMKVVCRLMYVFLLVTSRSGRSSVRDESVGETLTPLRNFVGRNLFTYSLGDTSSKCPERDSTPTNFLDPARSVPPWTYMVYRTDSGGRQETNVPENPPQITLLETPSVQRKTNTLHFAFSNNFSGDSVERTSGVTPSPHLLP